MPVAPRRARHTAKPPSGRGRTAASRFAVLAALSVALWVGWNYTPARGAVPQCDLALSLVFDTSSSMDSDEWVQMRNGIAASLLDDEIWQDAGGVVLQVVAFADKPMVMIPWTPASNRGDVATRVARMARPMIGSNTGIGTAMAFVAAQMPACDRQVIDIATDGENTAGLLPQMVRASLDPSIMINGLATTPEAAVFMERNIIYGLGSFVEIASGYEAFAEAMRRKLTRELYLG